MLLTCSFNNHFKTLLNAISWLGTGLKKLKTHVFAPGKGFLFIQLSLFLYIAFCRHNNEGELAFTRNPSLIYKLLLPVFQIFKGLLVCYITYQHTGVGTSIKGGSNRPEFLLTGCIPDLEGVGLIIMGDFFWEEIGSNCDSVGLLELVFYVSHNKRGFSYPWIAYYTNFKDFLLRIVHKL